MTSGVASSGFSEIWVCFEVPTNDPPPHALVLSFMPPAAEAAMEQRYGARIVNGRGMIEDVRSRARAEYVRLIATIGATPCLGGRTLRQALQGPGNYSRWWLLDVTEKDCLWDEDTIYLTILRLMTVQALKDKHGIEDVVLCGAPSAFAMALRRRRRPGIVIANLARALAAGVLGRVMLLIEHAGLWWTLRNLPRSASEHRDILLQGYWDSTVRSDGEGSVEDRYFTDLPGELALRGLSVGWLTSFESGQRGRTRRDVAAAACVHRDITLLEHDLTPADIVRAISNLRYPIQVTRAVVGRRFRRMCRVGAFDLHPLISKQLLRAAWGAAMCRLQLVATATTRACRRVRPEVVLTLFELFVRCRAVYAGVRSSSLPIRVWAAQHAGYSSDKTLGVVDPEIEMRGMPDGCAVPAPDGVFAIGDLSARIWKASGFPSAHVIVTGGLRYQKVRIRSRAAEGRGGPITLLLAGGMCEAAHVDLCDAVIAASAGLSSLRLLWRDHPLYRFSQRQSFRRFHGSITVTSGTLDDDLQAADLVLFSQTGLAEEALLRGIPTWQWLWPGFNTSVFLDVPVIPSFTSVSALRRELGAFVAEPARYQPTVETQRRVLRECFGPDPAGASARIAEAIQQMIAADARVHA